MEGAISERTGSGRFMRIVSSSLLSSSFVFGFVKTSCVLLSERLGIGETPEADQKGNTMRWYSILLLTYRSYLVVEGCWIYPHLRQCLSGRSTMLSLISNVFSDRPACCAMPQVANISLTANVFRKGEIVGAPWLNDVPRMLPIVLADLEHSPTSSTLHVDQTSFGLISCSLMCE